VYAIISFIIKSIYLFILINKVLSSIIDFKQHPLPLTWPLFGHAILKLFCKQIS